MFCKLMFNNLVNCCKMDKNSKNAKLFVGYHIIYSA